MKRTIISVDVAPELKEFIKEEAKKKKTSFSKLVRAALKKATKYKEKELV